MQLSPRALRAFAPLALALACEARLPEVEPSECGPSQAEVTRVIDGDTIDITLDDGSVERVRYLLIDTPESVGGKDDCYGKESAAANRALVEGQRVALAYDEDCRDSYDRLLAYVYTPEGEVNRALVEGGHACVWVIPPNGVDRADEFRALEEAARAAERGLWGACAVATCQH